MSDELKGTAQKFQNRLQEFGHPHKVEQFTSKAGTVKEAADTIGCKPEQIAKSIVFQMEDSKEAVIVIASGVNQINTVFLEILAGEGLALAEPEFVKLATGYSIGGVPPILHDRPIITFIDEDLMAYDEIWAAAGHPQAVFKLTPQELKSMTLAEVVKVGNPAT